MLSLPTPTTAPLRCRCCYCCCCCCCVPKLSMCPSITRFPYRYVGVFYVGDMKKPTDKKRVGFRFRFYWATVETTLKSCLKTTEKNDFRFSVHNPGTGSSDGQLTTSMIYQPQQPPLRTYVRSVVDAVR